MVAVVLALGVVLAGQAVAAPESADGVSGGVAAQSRPHRGPTVVVAAGDISSCRPPSCPSTDTARLVRRIDPARVLTLGDTQYDRGAYAEFNSEYDKTWGTFRGRTRPAPGNHEYLTPGASGYYRYFGRRGHREHAGYYSFDIRRWHMVALNSNDGNCSIVGCGPRSKQLQWLRHDLKADKSSCVLAYWHHPPFSSPGAGGNRQMRAMWKVLARHGADIVLNGHDHNYERFAPRNGAGSRARAGHGVRQFIVGTGGVPLNAFTDSADPLAVRQIDQHHGVLKLALRRTSYRFNFVAVGGRVLDQGGPISCT